MNKGDDMEMIVQEGIHFIDLQRLIFARRGKARSVLGLDPLAGRLRAGLPKGAVGRIGRMVWRSEFAVNRGDLLAVVFMAVLAVAFIAALLADVR